MFSLGKSGRIANIVVSDYAIRVIENNGKDLASIKVIEEKQIPANTIVEGKIVDELIFFNLVKEAVREWGIKGRSVRFYAPSSLVIMREVNIPNSVLEIDIESHLAMEMGKTIHLPFDNPIFDFSVLPKAALKEGEPAGATYKASVYAAPEEELVKYIQVFSDASLKPIDVDVEPLGIYRYFYHYYIAEQAELNANDAFLLIEANLTSVNMSIFEGNHLNLLRYQKIDFSINEWETTEGPGKRLSYDFIGDEARLELGLTDVYKEIERILNFFRFSLNQGESEIKEIILTGDFPYLEGVAANINQRFGMNTMILTANDPSLVKHNISSVFIPAVGLSLKGDK